MVICDFRPLSCLSIVVSISIGWPRCVSIGYLDNSILPPLSQQLSWLWIYLFRIHDEQKNREDSRCKYLQFWSLFCYWLHFQSALLWYGAPCGVWAGKFILGQRRHALICSVLSPDTCHATSLLPLDLCSRNSFTKVTRLPLPTWRDSGLL